MSAPSCTTTGTLHPCLYPACSRICLLDEANYIHPCNNGNKAGYFRGCVCGQMGGPNAPFTDTQVRLFYDQVLSCVAGALGTCDQSEQQLFWNTHTDLCAQDNFTVPGSLKPAAFGATVTATRTETDSTASLGTVPTTTSPSISSASPTSKNPTASKSGSSIGTADIIGMIVGLAGLVIGIVAVLLVCTWKRNNAGKLEMLWRNDKSKFRWFWEKASVNPPQTGSIPLQ